MTAILVVFITACFFALGITPMIKKLAVFLNLLDTPSARKIHKKAVPRIGGIAVFLAFLFPFFLLPAFPHYEVALQDFFTDPRTRYFFIGGILIFLLGLLDDLHPLSFQIKFIGQILIALFVCLCGFRIDLVTVPFNDSLSLGIFSVPVTIFWFVLVMNAINLVDGLDGLATGICLFVSLSMLIVCATGGRMTAAFSFAALAGSLTGFLRYNFYPASIFLGDSGSYFLGYCLAALSIAGTFKGQMTTAMLIPIIALGVPLIDTVCAPVRRFLVGQKMFQPDMSHIHHKLVKLGYNHRRAVLLIYGMTVILAVCSMILVHAQNETSALILFTLGAAVIGTAQYLGAADLISMRKMVIWFKDISDEAGLRSDRRVFFSHQLKIAQASSPDEFWEAACASLAALQFDCAEFNYIDADSFKEGRTIRRFCWQEGETCCKNSSNQNFLLKIELPLYSCRNGICQHFGSLILMKDMRNETSDHYLLKRVEHLRRSMVSSLLKISAGIQQRSLS